MPTNANPPDPDDSLNVPDPANDIDARKRAAGFPNMLNPLFEKYEQVHRMHCEHDRNSAKAKYAIGELVAEVAADPDSYGRGAVGTLSKSLGIKDTQLRECQHIAQAWTPAEFAKLMKRTNRSGLPLTFSLLTEIRRVTASDPLGLAGWVDLALENDWSVRELRAEMAKKAGEAADENADTNTAANTDSNTDADVETGDVLPSFLMVRRSLVEMRDTIWQVQGGVATWRLRIFSPLGEDPAQFGYLVLDSLVQTRDVCLDSQQALHDLIERLDVAILAAREAAAAEGGDEDGE